MDLVLYFIDHGVDWSSLAILLIIYVGLEIVGEFIAEIAARPLVTKVRDWMNRKYEGLKSA